MKSMKHKMVKTVAGVLGGILVAASAAGSNRELIEALVENEALTPEQAEELSRPEQPPVTPAGKNFKDFRIRGRIQTQFGYVRAENENTDGSEDWSTLEMRRVRLGVRGTLLQNVRAQLEANLVPGSDVSMRSAFLQWREYEPAYIKVGFDRPAFGFERTTSSASILTVERSNLTNTIITNDMTGVSLEGRHSLFSYGAGLYTNRSNRNPDGLPSRYLYNGSAAVTLDRFLPEEHGLSFRGDVIFNDDLAGDEAFRFEEGYSLSGHYTWGRFDFRAEYLRADDADGDTTDGWYIMPSFMIAPKWQAVARYEQADSDDVRGIRAPSRYARRAPNLGDGGAQRGDDYDALYLGANYYIKGDANKLMAGLEFSELATETAGDLEATTVYAAWRVLF